MALYASSRRVDAPIKKSTMHNSVAEISLIICRYVAILSLLQPLFRRCYLAVSPLLCAAVFRAKSQPDQSLADFARARTATGADVPHRIIARRRRCGRRRGAIPG